MSSSRLRLMLTAMSVVIMHSAIAERTQVTLRTEPAVVTASFNSADAGVYDVQISVQNGPITHLVDTTLRADSGAALSRLLAQQVRSQPPYLLVHASCGGGVGRCEREVVFKILEQRVLRLATLVGTANSVLRNGHFYDRYDKLDRVAGASGTTAPTFEIALDDRDHALQVNPGLTWASNASLWRSNAGTLTAMAPQANWQEADWDIYLSAALSNAALARYCDRRDELRALLAEIEPQLDTVRRRWLTDALSTVTPRESPSQWRVARQ